MNQRPRKGSFEDNDNELYERFGKRSVPRWVTVAVIVLAVIGLLFVIMLLVGGLGGHGPQRHMGMPLTQVIG